MAMALAPPSSLYDRVGLYVGISTPAWPSSRSSASFCYQNWTEIASYRRINYSYSQGIRRIHRIEAKSSGWAAPESPYDTLGVEKDADDEGIRSAYRRMAKLFHPDVYDGSEGLEEGETIESRFIKIQAAYELLMDREKRREYDIENSSNPMKASKAWMEWVMKKKKAFDQRGDMAISTWQEQQQRDMNLKARRLSRNKEDPEEERRLLAKERQASTTNIGTTLKRHSLVLRKRDLVRKRAEEEANKKLIQQLLAEEGLELDDDRFT